MSDTRTLLPLKREILSEQVVRIISDGLLSERFQPGVRLVESDIAQQLGISRSPVREALAELEKQGLVDRKTGRGATVRQWTVRDIEEVFYVRSELEGCAVRLATERVRRRDLEGLNTIVARMWEAVKANDISALNELDLEFHSEIWRLSGNGFLERVLNGLRLQLRIIMALNQEIHPRLEEIPEIHQEMVDVIGSSDPERAELVMKAHFKDSVARMMQAAPARMTRDAKLAPANKQAPPEEEKGTAATD